MAKSIIHSSKLKDEGLFVEDGENFPKASQNIYLSSVKELSSSSTRSESVSVAEYSGVTRGLSILEDKSPKVVIVSYKPTEGVGDTVLTIECGEKFKQGGLQPIYFINWEFLPLSIYLRALKEHPVLKDVSENEVFLKTKEQLQAMVKQITEYPLESGGLEYTGYLRELQEDMFDNYNRNVKSLKFLIGLLQHKKILPAGISIDFDAGLESILSQISGLSNGSFNMIASYRQAVMKDIPIIKSAPFVFVVSYFHRPYEPQPLDGMQHIKLGQQGKFLGLDGITSTPDAGDKYSYAMGIGPGFQGLLVDDLIKREVSDKAFKLAAITNKGFKKLLFYKDVYNCKHLIKTTEFIAAYPQHMFTPLDATKLIVNMCRKAIALKPEKNHFLIKLGGEYDFQGLISDENQVLLRRAGFTEICYYNPSTSELNTIPLQTRPGKPVVLKLFPEFFTISDNEKFNQLSDSVMLISGDNGVKDAFSLGVIPIFTPHFSEKLEVLTNLAIVLIGSHDHHAGGFVHSIKFLQAYTNLYDMGFLVKTPDQFSKILDLVTPELLQEWPKVCKYVVDNFNLSKTLLGYAQKALVTPSALFDKDVFDEMMGKSVIDELFVKHAIDNGFMIQDQSAMFYALSNGVTIRGENALHYALRNKIKIDHLTPVEYLMYKVSYPGAIFFSMISKGIKYNDGGDPLVDLLSQSRKNPHMLESLTGHRGARADLEKTVIKRAFKERHDDELNEQLMLYTLQKNIMDLSEVDRFFAEEGIDILGESAF